MSAHVLAEIGVPTAGECLQALAPIAGIVLLNWLFRNTDAIVHRLFPNLEWERQLGWLNIRSERRAAAALRSLGHLVYALLAAALGGILWSAVDLAQLRPADDPQVLHEIPGSLPVLFACLGIWAMYLAGHLVPRLRREYEEEELERFRTELAGLERKEEALAGSGARTPHGPLLGTKAGLAPGSRSRR